MVAPTPTTIAVVILADLICLLPHIKDCMEGLKLTLFVIRDQINFKSSSRVN